MILAKSFATQSLRHQATATAAKKLASVQLFSTVRETLPHHPSDKAAIAEVAATTEKWLKTVTGQKPTSPAETAALYANDGVLWATVSTELRVNPKEIRDYFDVFARLPNLTVTDYKPFIRMYGDIALNDGYYTVHFDSPDGKKVTTKARYVFVYKRNESSGAWEIIDHHSSAMPVAPAGLKTATTVAPPS
ncbi:protein conserved in bacteria with a cystatin-like fold containing protein [Nannochloropsis oceanica]